MSHHVESKGLYFAVFGALMVLTVITVWVAGLDLGRYNDLVAMAVAGTKASLVIWFFMNVRRATVLTKMAVAVSAFFVILLFGITLADYYTRGWLGPLGK